MTAFLTLSQKLSDSQWDFDLGDEYTLARHARAEGGYLKVGQQRYSCVIVSECMQNMLSSTVELLKSCSENGVAVIAAGSPGCYVDGTLDEDTYSELRSGWTTVPPGDIGVYLATLLERRISAADPFPEGFQHMRRKLEDGNEIWFFANQAMDTYQTSIVLEGKGVRQLDLLSGEEKRIPYDRRGGKLVIPIDLVRNQSLMLIVSQNDGEPGEQKEGTLYEVQLHLTGIKRECDNFYPICYADYGVRKDTYVEILCDQIFRECGFESNPWSRKVQFKRNVVDRNSVFDESSGFTAAYHFTVDENFVADRMLAIAEHPELCMLRVNGEDVSWLSERNSLDHHLGTADIRRYVLPGENLLEVVVPRFHVLMELDAIYLQGDFSVRERDGKWILSSPEPLQYGPWNAQGLPFYPYAVQYAYEVALEHKPETAKLDVTDYHASVVSVAVNDKNAGLLHLDGMREKDIAKFLVEGTNHISLRVCGTFKNLMGPHFVKARGTAWPAMWKESPEHPPAAAQYDLMTYGIQSPPLLRITK